MRLNELFKEVENSFFILLNKVDEFSFKNQIKNYYFKIRGKKHLDSKLNS